MQKWYVVQVETGHEDSTAAEISNAIADAACVSEVFVPRYAARVRKGGAWVDSTPVLFPGYVIVATSNIDALKERIGNVEDFARLLSNADMFLPLEPDEVFWIDRLTAGSMSGSGAVNDASACDDSDAGVSAVAGGMSARKRVVGMSTGYVEGGKVIVTSGPLFGCEALITKAYRHKQQVQLELQMFGRTVTTRLGMEFVSPKPKRLE